MHSIKESPIVKHSSVSKIRVVDRNRMFLIVMDLCYNRKYNTNYCSQKEFAKLLFHHYLFRTFKRYI